MMQFKRGDKVFYYQYGFPSFDRITEGSVITDPDDSYMVSPLAYDFPERMPPYLVFASRREILDHLEKRFAYLLAQAEIRRANFVSEIESEIESLENELNRINNAAQLG